MSDGVDGTVTSSDTSASLESSPAAQAERTFTQAQVNAILSKQKQEFRESLGNSNAQQAAQATQVAQMQQAGMTQEQIGKIVAEQLQRNRDEWIQQANAQQMQQQAKQTLDKFFTGLEPGKEKYQDFDDVVGDIELKSFPKTISLLADNVDNIHDVMYEMGKDPAKMSVYERLAKDSPTSAIKALKKLSQSIKDNDEALQRKQPNAPLNKIQAGKAGLSGTSNTIGDLARDPRYRR